MVRKNNSNLENHNQSKIYGFFAIKNRSQVFPFQHTQHGVCCQHCISSQVSIHHTEAGRANCYVLFLINVSTIYVFQWSKKRTRFPHPDVALAVKRNRASDLSVLATDTVSETFTWNSNSAKLSEEPSASLLICKFKFTKKNCLSVAVELRVISNFNWLLRKDKKKKKKVECFAERNSLFPFF